MAQRNRSAAKEAYWREVVGKQRQSGKSVRAFCAEAGVSEPSFYAWRRELRRRDAGPIEAEIKETNAKPSKAVAVSPKLVPVAVIQEQPQNGESQNGESQNDASKQNQHLDPSQHATDTPIEIVTPCGFILKLGEHVDAQRLEMVLGVIEQQTHRASQPASPQREATSC